MQKNTQPVKIYLFILGNSNSTLSIQEIKGIRNTIEDKNSGKVLLMKNSLGEVICLIYIFFELSDWRNSIMWWAYQIKINSKFVDEFDKRIIEIINRIVLKCNESDSSVMRFILSKENVVLLEAKNNGNELLVSKSHYDILVKNL